MPLEFVHSPTQQTFDIGSRLTRLLTLLFSLVIVFNTIFAFSVLVNLKSLDTCMFLSSDCSWSAHIDYIKDKAWSRVNILRSLKFTLDRLTLETINMTFIRPLLEYGDIIFDNCTAGEKQELDKIQHEAARIVTGATKLVSIDKLYSDLNWQPLSDRRTNHKLIFMFKIKSNISPTYLVNLIPLRPADPRYNLRNSSDIPLIHCRSTLYYNSLVPSAIRAWNTLDSSFKSADSIQSFKRLISNTPKVPHYFNTGPRRLQVHHTRLRLDCSLLNYDLYRKNIISLQACLCGDSESVRHFMLFCPLYTSYREDMFESINLLVPGTAITLDLLLKGNVRFTDPFNSQLFSIVYSYIDSTKRFI
ncbi:uncharacterized protein LOC128205494 [Mya arenaria]|uniref:uncharacterized protein LOC128205494 n=1 Tax=Mya arenaria TaxID=6604 RepID=UPI0022E7D6B4|nr:uncharacterized protein LOC128205494 [Mya arenaria]